MTEQVAAWITGIGAILAAAAGVLLVVREVRRKERLAAMETVQRMERTILFQQDQSIAFHAYVFTLRKLCADHGIDAPAPPPEQTLDLAPAKHA